MGSVRIFSSVSSTKYFYIDKIVIEGNRRTKERIIRRELDFLEGDSILIEKADSLLKWERNKIVNTNLFVTTDLELTRNDTTGFSTLKIIVHEQWYTIPQPILGISDRNYNEWVLTHGADLRRVNIGLKLLQRNIFGLNHTLQFTVQGGFTNFYELGYNIPYLNKKQTLGMGFVVNYSTNRSVGYATFNHKIKFYPEVERITLANPIIKDSYKIGISFSYRKQFYTKHSWESAFIHNRVDDTIAVLNPQFFLKGQSLQQYVYFKYTFEIDKRDIKQFAHKGYYFKIEAEQLGFTPKESQQMSRLTLTYNMHFEIGKRFLFATKIKAKTAFPVLQPYTDFRALSLGEDFVRGYELYPVDGQHYGLVRNSFRFKVYSLLFDFKKLIPIKQFRKVPMDFYITTFADAGYVSNQNSFLLNNFNNTRFSNTMMASWGVGINFVSFYNSVIRLEISRNLAGEWNPRFSMAADI